MHASPRIDLRTAVPLALLWLTPFVLRLGGAPLFDVDEGAFAEATREMLVSGDFVSTTLDGAPRFDKPILAYWLQAASVHLSGGWPSAGAAAYRLPSALAAWGWCMAIAYFALAHFGRRAAVLAGSIAATSLGVFAIGRAATADALLNLLLVLAMFDAWRHLERGARTPLLRAYAWVGLGLLAKGPIALLVPAAVVTLYCASAGEWRRWRAAAFNWRGWAILLAFAGPWYALAYLRHGQDFIDGFLIRHNVARYTSVLEGHAGSLGYYLALLPVLLLPWSGLLLPLLARVRTWWQQPCERFLLIWVVFVLAFFSFSGTKLPHYALYGATPLFLLMARVFDATPRAAGWAQAGVPVLLGLIAGLPWLIDLALPRVSDALYQALLRDALQGALPIATGAAAALLVWVATRTWTRDGMVRAISGAVATALVMGGMAEPWLGEQLQGPIRRAALAARQMPGNFVQWGVRWSSVSVVRGQSTPRRAPQPGEFAFVRMDRLPALAGGGHHEVLFAERGVGLIRWQGGP